MKMKTHYDVLGVPRQADDEAIRAAFRKAAKTYHPDLNVGDPAAEQHVKQIIAAYEVLRNPKQRAAYDLGLDVRRQQNARRFLGTAFASAGLVSGIALALVAWQSKLHVASVPVFAPSASSALEREVSDAAVEINEPTNRKVASSNHEPPPHHEPSASTPQPGTPVVEASRLMGHKVAISDHESPDDVADLGNDQKPILRAAADGVAAERALQQLRRLGSSAIANEDGTTAIAAKDPENAAPSKDPQFYLARGLLRSGKSDLDGAIADFDEAIGIDPRSALAFSHRAKAWGAKADLDRALADFQMAIRIDPTSAAIFRDRGILWRRSGAPDRALVDFDQAIRLGFSDAAAYNERGQVWLERGHYERAIADFNQAIKIDPNFASAYANRAVALRSKGDVERAFADSNHASRLDPSVSLARSNVVPSGK
jgi:Tfp pilus assembly protein PilF